MKTLIRSLSVLLSLAALTGCMVDDDVDAAVDEDRSAALIDAGEIEHVESASQRGVSVAELGAADDAFAVRLHAIYEAAKSNAPACPLGDEGHELIHDVGATGVDAPPDGDDVALGMILHEESDTPCGNGGSAQGGEKEDPDPTPWVTHDALYTLVTGE